MFLSLDETVQLSTMGLHILKMCASTNVRPKVGSRPDENDEIITLV